MRIIILQINNKALSNCKKDLLYSKCTRMIMLKFMIKTYISIYPIGINSINTLQ